MKAQCVTGCGRPTHNATLCTACTTKLERDLAEIPGYAEDLEIAETRQSVMGGQVGASGTERPLPWDERATNATHEMKATLVAIVRDMQPADDDWPADNIASIGRWLLMHLPEIRQRLDADDIAHQVKLTMRAVRWVIDRPGDNWYAGPCRAEFCTEPADGDDDPEPDACCVVDLYAKHDADAVVCRNCGTAHDAAERQRWLLAAAQDTLAHAELIGRAAPNLGLDITPSAIRGYALRGRLAPHGYRETLDANGEVKRQPLYRVGDVIDLANEAMTRRAERDAKRSA